MIRKYQHTFRQYLAEKQSNLIMKYLLMYESGEINARHQYQ